MWDTDPSRAGHARARGRGRTVALLAALAALACRGGEYPTAVGTPALVVHAMLAAGEPRQELLLEYTRDVADGFYRGLTPASGAQVSVEGDASYTYTEDPARPGVYRAAFTPRPGVRYGLRIRGPAGEAATAETLVPGATRLVAPSADTALARGGGVTFRWTRDPSAAAYVLGNFQPGAPSSIGGVVAPKISTDTSESFQPLFTATYRVATVDANYLRYMGTSSSDSTGGGRGRFGSTVTGAYGLFGSYGLSNPRTVTVR